MKWKPENRPLSPSEIYFGKRMGLIPIKPTKNWPFPPVQPASGLQPGNTDLRDAL
jgi:hypothetical protein